MVKLSVRYDKGLKENVFMLRDDESYVSSTKTVLTVSEPTIEAEYDYLMYGVDVTINVLRETGTSKVTLYDGDYVLDSFDWDGSAITEHYDFPMGTSHELRAIFTGNKYCLTSQSKVETVSLDASAYTTRIKYLGEPIIKTNTLFEFELTDEHGVYINQGTLTLSYSDGVKSGMETVSVENGYASVTFDDLDEIVSGLINLTAVFDEATDYSRSVLDFQVSKFYDVGITGSSGYGSSYVVGENYTLTGTMTDFFGEPYTETETVSIYGYNGFSDEWDLLDSGTMNNGKFQTVLSNNEYETYGKYRFGTHEEYGFEELNPVLTPTLMDVTDLYFTSLGASQNIEDRFTVDAYGSYVDEEGQISMQYLSNVPIHLTGTGVNDTFVTNAQGRITCSYTPQLIESGSTLTISSGSASITHNMQYYVTDYVAPNWKGQDLTLEYMTKQALSNGMKYSTSSTTFIPMVYFKIPEGYEGKKQKFSCTVVSASNQKFYVGIRAIDDSQFTFDTQSFLSTGNNVECTYDPSTTVAVVKVNGTEKLRRSISKPYQLAILNGQVAGNIVLNNIKHEVL